MSIDVLQALLSSCAISARSPGYLGKRLAKSATAQL